MRVVVTVEDTTCASQCASQGNTNSKERVVEKVCDPSTYYNEEDYHVTKFKVEKKYRIGYALVTSLIVGASCAIFVPVAGMTAASVFGVTTASIFVLGSALGLFTMGTRVIDYGEDYVESAFNGYREGEPFTLDDDNTKVGRNNVALSSDVRPDNEETQKELLRLERKISSLQNSQLKLSNNERKALEVLTKAYEQQQQQLPQRKPMPIGR